MVLFVFLGLITIVFILLLRLESDQQSKFEKFLQDKSNTINDEMRLSAYLKGLESSRRAVFRLCVFFSILVILSALLIDVKDDVLQIFAQKTPQG